MMQLLRFGFDAARDGEGARVHVAAQLRRATGSWYVASRAWMSCSMELSLWFQLGISVRLIVSLHSVVLFDLLSSPWAIRF